MRFITATADGRTVAAGFPLIEDRELRRAVARIAWWGLPKVTRLCTRLRWPYTRPAKAPSPRSRRSITPPELCPTRFTMPVGEAAASGSSKA
jgi:hypothetical protein